MAAKAPSKHSKNKLKSKSKLPDVEASDDENTSSGSSDSQEEEDADQIGKGVCKGPIVIDREEYLLAHRDLTFDRNQLQVKNNILHRRLAEYYKKRKLEHVLKPLEGYDLEEKYQQKLFAFEEFKDKEDLEIADIKSKLQAVGTHYEDLLKRAEKKFEDLQDHERNTGTGLIYSKKGKPIPPKTVARFLSLQKSKAEQSSAMMLRYIRVRNAVSEQEAIIRKLERIGPGLYVAKYEQLGCNKLNYTNKVEERDDELIKNRGKCTEHNQMLAHIREKMHHTDEVIEFTECDLGDAEIEYQRAREGLSVVKTRRDKLRIYMAAERLRAGLITKKDLLRDFEDAIDLLEKLKDRKERLEMSIAKTNMELRTARRCITFSNEPNSSNDRFDDEEDFPP